jgi:hypothetical protein
LIAIFVPWSWKDTAVFERSWVGLWQNCLEITNHPLNQNICEDNDVDIVASVAGGNLKCRGYIVATQVFTVAAVVFSFLALIFALLLIGQLWAMPIALAFYVALLTMFAFGCCLVAFLMWIIYAEQACLRCEDVPTVYPSYWNGVYTTTDNGFLVVGPVWNGTAYVITNASAVFNQTYYNSTRCPLIPQPRCTLFPLKGYSWGWICMVVATGLAFLAMLLAYLALLKILMFKPFIPHDEPCCPQPCPMVPVMEAPCMESQPYYEPAVPMMAPCTSPMMAYSPMLPAY